MCFQWDQKYKPEKDAVSWNIPAYLWQKLVWIGCCPRESLYHLHSSLSWNNSVLKWITAMVGGEHFDGLKLSKAHRTVQKAASINLIEHDFWSCVGSPLAWWIRPYIYTVTGSENEPQGLIIQEGGPMVASQTSSACSWLAQGQGDSNPSW